MSKSDNPIATLADLLAGHAQPIIVPERLAPSAFYDLQYRLFVIAAAFEIHGDSPLGQRRINATRLKLLQFIAMRPWLLSMVRQWSAARNDAQVSFFSQRLRRGFLGDTMHDNVIGFLVARGILVWSGKFLTAGKVIGQLQELFTDAVGLNLFSTERATLEELKDIRITNDMLEGW